MRVEEIMTAKLISVDEGASLLDALKMMVAQRVSALIVIDATGAPVGVLSEGDLMRRAEFGAEKRRPRWLEFLIGGGKAARDYALSHGRRVEELMTRGVISVEAGAEVGEAVDLMLEKRVRRLLVTRGGEPAGVVSRSDLVRALMRALPDAGEPRPDADLKAAIESEFARHAWVPFDAVRVSVQDGVATLEGAVTEDAVRGGLKVLAENVAGVKAVRDQLAWIEPNSGFYVPPPGER